MTKTISNLYNYLDRKWKYHYYYYYSSNHHHHHRAIISKNKLLSSVIVLTLLVWVVYVSLFWTEEEGYNDGVRSKLILVDDNNNRLMMMSTESEAVPFKTVISYDENNSDGGGSRVVRLANGSFVTLSLPQFTRLERLFYRADSNRDGFLTESELGQYINQAVRDHLANAMKNNYQRYSELDNDPRNGLVTWKEYVTHYFKKIGISTITLDDVRDKSSAFTGLPKDFKVEIARLEATWSEAANNSPDFVTVDEFLSLEHPEASPTRLLTLVTDVFSTFDLDGDGIIEKSEFETTYREAEGVDKVYKEDFRIIDSDRNEKVTRLELMKYIDPRNIHHAQKDAKQILQVTDLDKDGKMSLHEAIICGSYLVRSKFYDVVYRLHNPE